MPDPWTVGGATALQQHAPTVLAALTGVVALWPVGVDEARLAAIRAVTAEGLGLPPLRGPASGPRRTPLAPAPEVMPFAEQLAVDVTRVDQRLREDWLDVVGDAVEETTFAVWVADAVPRARVALDRLFGPDVWGDPSLTPTRHARQVVEELLREITLLGALDPVTTELVRLRVARHLGSRSALACRSLAAVEAGADAATFAAVDRYRDSHLDAAQKAALGLVDGITWTPADLRETDLDDVRRHLAPDQAVEVVLDVLRHSVDKVDVALGRDAPAHDGLRLFVVDAHGGLAFP